MGGTTRNSLRTYTIKWVLATAAVPRFYEQSASRLTFETLGGGLVVIRADGGLLCKSPSKVASTTAKHLRAPMSASGSWPTTVLVATDSTCSAHN